MPKIIVDGISYEADASNNLLEALLTLKKDLPYFLLAPVPWVPSVLADSVPLYSIGTRRMIPGAS